MSASTQPSRFRRGHPWNIVESEQFGYGAAGRALNFDPTLVV
ncbi:MAG TPA: hypothetical protein VKR27_02155 [Acidimicrobiales bacterium]|nr:hypothetical protein [Acidimicrobiales bacterium]